MTTLADYQRDNVVKQDIIDLYDAFSLLVNYMNKVDTENLTLKEMRVMHLMFVDACKVISPKACMHLSKEGYNCEDCLFYDCCQTDNRAAQHKIVCEIIHQINLYKRLEGMKDSNHIYCQSVTDVLIGNDTQETILERIKTLLKDLPNDSLDRLASIRDNYDVARIDR